MFGGDSLLANGRLWLKKAYPSWLLPQAVMEHPGWLKEIHGEILTGWLSSENIGFAEFLAGPSVQTPDVSLCRRLVCV
jgi:hypothetical protein